MRPQSQKCTRLLKHKYFLQPKRNQKNKTETASHNHVTLTMNFDQTPQKIKYHYTQNNEDEFRQTAYKLSERNFSHHDPNLCLCQECSCGRHLCKMHVIKPDLTKKTIYQKSFYPQKAKQSLIVFAQEYDQLKGPHLGMSSTYLEGFTGRNGDQIERPKPQDLLHSEGPGVQLTSYAAEFPGHKGRNQYVKPTDRHTRGYFPLKCKSTYSGAFVTKSLKKDNYKYMADQLKTGCNWLGTTTYNNFYAQPNPEYFAKQVKVVEKRQEKPADRLRFKTTYGGEFSRKENTACPAKIHLQTREKSSFSQNKINFSENTDFKGLSKNFHAFSTSKQHF